jgi:hypothetical protein
VKAIGEEVFATKEKIDETLEESVMARSVLGGFATVTISRKNSRVGVSTAGCYS